MHKLCNPGLIVNFGGSSEFPFFPIGPDLSVLVLRMVRSGATNHEPPPTHVGSQILEPTFPHPRFLTDQRKNLRKSKLPKNDEILNHRKDILKDMTERNVLNRSLYDK